MKQDRHISDNAADVLRIRDNALAQSVADGDEEALRSVIRNYGDLVFRTGMTPELELIAFRCRWTDIFLLRNSGISFWRQKFQVAATVWSFTTASTGSTLHSQDG